MTPELLALETYLAELYRDASSTRVKAEQAGLNTSHLDITGPSVADIWHVVIQQAAFEGRLDDLIAVIVSERPSTGGTGKRITEMYEAYLAAQPPARKQHRNPPQGQAGDDLSDYRNDERRDARIDQMQRDMADMRVQVAGLVVQVSALTEMVRKQSEHDSPPLSNTQFAAIMTAFAVIAILVFAAVYWGGNR